MRVLVIVLVLSVASVVCGHISDQQDANLIVNPTYATYPGVRVFADEEFHKLWGAYGEDVIWDILNQVNRMYKDASMKTLNPSRTVTYLLGDSNPVPGEKSAFGLLRAFREFWGDEVEQGGYDMAILFSGKKLDLRVAAFDGTACNLCAADVARVRAWQAFASQGVAVVRLSEMDLGVFQAGPVDGVREIQDGSEEINLGLVSKGTAQGLGHLQGAPSLLQSAVVPLQGCDPAEVMCPIFPEEGIPVEDLYFSCASVATQFRTCTFEMTDNTFQWVDFYDCVAPH